MKANGLILPIRDVCRAIVDGFCSSRQFGKLVAASENKISDKKVLKATRYLKKFASIVFLVKN
jgi:hypothetical protein